MSLTKLALGLAALVFALGLVLAGSESVAAEDGWVIHSFGARYAIQPSGTINVVEDILVEFTASGKHGIVRDIPVVFGYDEKHDREYKIGVTSVTDGQKPWQYDVSRQGSQVRIKIGDPDKTVSGQQRYVISYTLQGALNAFDDYDELVWNALGSTTTVPVERTTVVVEAPSITKIDCKFGPAGSNEPCATGISPSRADFQANRTLQPGDQFTFGVVLEKGTVQVPAPALVTRKSVGEQIRDFVGLKPLPLAAATFLTIVASAGLWRLWWVQGRDRWYGDVQYLSGSRTETERPLMATETVVVEYAPPDVGQPKRELRPAEVGVLMDERADTLDVSATIVDLAVRGYLKILEPERHEYSLQKLQEPDAALLDYESDLLTSLFEKADGQGVVELKELKDKFYTDLAEVKKKLYKLTVDADRIFPRSPESVRTIYLIAGVTLAGLGAGAVFGLGAIGAAIVGIPLVLAGLVLLAINGAMTRRTASGRELYRRARGFREYMVTAETDHARFEEEANLFEKYLPYAIVFRCTEKWAKAFEGLARQPSASAWYVSPYPFAIASFSHDIGSFSSSVAGVMASTPSSSGSSGFGGGGFSSGGGGGGGGVGSW